MAGAAVSATGSTQTFYPELVNGYLCYDSVAVQKARNFTNPYPPVTTASVTTSVARPAAAPGYSAQGKGPAAATRGRALDIFA